MPPDESRAERKARRSAERAAKNTSDAIDKQLRKEQEKLTKQRVVRVLLLGQKECGKSTILKQFQLAYMPDAFHEDRLAWRPVIYLNLVRSVLCILDALASHSPVNTGSKNEYTESDTRGTSAVTTPVPVVLSARIVELISRLSPLIALEEQLIKQLVGGDGETTQFGLPAPGAPQSHSSHPASPRKGNEVAVSHRNNWKKAFNKLLNRGGRPSIYNCEGWRTNSPDPAHILDRCRSDIEALWADKEVQAALGRKRIALEDYSGFHLDSVPRIATLHYVPSDGDIFKAYRKTLGVVEHTFSLKTENKHKRSVDWKFYDFAGRQDDWPRFFGDMDAIVFVAPISAFDQVLSEDWNVNRLADSFRLWCSLIRNSLLSHVNIVLLLNKCDLLERKLEAGVRFARYVISYGDRPNDYKSVTKYLRKKFIAAHKAYSTNPKREVYVHLTVLTDTRQNLSIITKSVKDIIVEGNLKIIKCL